MTQIALEEIEDLDAEIQECSVVYMPQVVRLGSVPTPMMLDFFIFD